MYLKQRQKLNSELGTSLQVRAFFLLGGQEVGRGKLLRTRLLKMLAEGGLVHTASSLPAPAKTLSLKVQSHYNRNDSILLCEEGGPYEFRCLSFDGTAE